jgi:hypothetical protein
MLKGEEKKEETVREKRAKYKREIEVNRVN